MVTGPPPPTVLTGDAAGVGQGIKVLGVKLVAVTDERQGGRNNDGDGGDLAVVAPPALVMTQK